MLVSLTLDPPGREVNYRRVTACIIILLWSVMLSRRSGVLMDQEGLGPTLALLVLNI